MTPFPHLVRHFFRRFFDTETTGLDGDMRLTIGPVLGILAAPGALMSLLLFFKYSSLLRWFTGDLVFDETAAALPDKYTFLAYAMAVTGVVTALKWDGLFLDRRDHANISPLPISMRSIFLAKLIALLLFLLLFTVAVNAFSSFLFPLIAMEHRGGFADVVRFIGSHFLSVAAATLFVFCSMLALIGVLMSLLPYAIFRRTTRYFQCVLIALWLGLFFISPAISPELQALRESSESLTRYLPTVWFLGLYETLHARASDGYRALGGIAINALLLSGLTAACAHGLSYRTIFLRASELPEIVPGPGRFSRMFMSFTDRIIRIGFERAYFRFIVKTLFRSERHAAILAASLALGVALSVQSLLLAVSTQEDGGMVFASALLAPSLTLSFFLVTGLRIAFGLQVDARANWVFQSAGEPPGADGRRVARRVILVALIPLLVVVAPAYAPWLGWMGAMLHTAFVALLAGLLTEALLAGSRAVPLTCRSLPGQANMVFALAMYVIVFIVFSQGMAGLEAWLLHSHHRFAGFFLLAGTGWVVLRRSHTEEPAGGLYEEAPEGLELLKISN
jgi:hypothetical protein